ncbi:unnamed protein product [Dicrocoelium dendriticum]|nr:unnamed protein product [Dicrocoelium dendriticum]
MFYLLLPWGHSNSWPSRIMPHMVLTLCVAISVLLITVTDCHETRRVIYHGPESYKGYHRSQPRSQPRLHAREDIRGVRLYGERRNDRTYQEGLGEMAALMD